MAAATGNVTNQAVQFQNNGAPSRQYFSGNNSCNGTTMQFSPFNMGNDTTPMKSDSYVKSNNWGAQVSFSVPLDGGMIETCKGIARKHEQKMRLDYELVRALKCTEIMQKGFTFRPGSRVEILCKDIVPIVALEYMETIVSVVIAVVAGGAAINNRLHNRITNVHDRISGLDRRIDAIELNVAQDYVSKADLAVMVQRMEDHMVRIENKLDQIVLRN